ncbi:hypothetical protein EVAR_39066_1 [Eumeta japonica]|uniref:Uncharacterized protein n=1 Tax=Eumeta variegata TaxID=151549 RepID=A0A4C1WNE8_EUMVA|nr:hypothetical protein EVAR_39066_1 [Eumeta japonica]
MDFLYRFVGRAAQRHLRPALSSSNRPFARPDQFVDVKRRTCFEKMKDEGKSGDSTVLDLPIGRVGRSLGAASS